VRLIGAFQDITEQINSRVQLENRHKELSLAFEARSLFLANMSHEIRTPINSILGVLQIVETSSLSAEQKRFLGLAKDSALSLLGVISDRLDFTKVDSSKLSLENVTVDINQLLNSCCDIFDIRAKTKPLIMTKDFASTQDVKALTDPTRLRQNFSNLLSNAIKFTHQGQVNITSQLSSHDVGQAYLSNNNSKRHRCRHHWRAEGSFYFLRLAKQTSQLLVSLAAKDYDFLSRRRYANLWAVT
jgi:signal transduction histidine kinase